MISFYMTAFKLEELLSFTKFFHKFQQLVRTIYVNGENRKENDVEHSYQLALTAWFICNSENLDFDINLIIKYSLIHDLVEVYAGDPYIVSDDIHKRDQEKKKLEFSAIDQIMEEIPGFTDFPDLMINYIEKNDEESKFIYALDKILPMINELLNEGKSHKEYNLGLKKLKAIQSKKIEVSEHISLYYSQIMEIYDSNEDKYFPICEAID